MSRKKPSSKHISSTSAAQGFSEEHRSFDTPSLSNQRLLNHMRNSSDSSVLDSSQSSHFSDLGLHRSLGNQEAQHFVQTAQDSSKSAKPTPPKDNNVLLAMHYLTTKLGWEAEFAAAWLGQAVVETGDPELKELDVVEHKAGAGRGMLQYTNDRRGPYDSARWQAIQSGQDVNDIQWQIDYALNEDNAGLYFDKLYKGLTDPKTEYVFQPNWGTALGMSPSGVRYNDKYKTANDLMKAYGEDKIAGYTRALTGEYTRPGEPHLDRRLQAARKIFTRYKRWMNSVKIKPVMI